MPDTASIMDMVRPSPSECAPGASPPTLAFRGVSMTFPGGTQALDSFSTDVRRGEFLSLIGPSGCGKSTVLRLAAGLEHATGGTVAVDADSVGFVSQDANLLPWRTVERNVELVPQLHRVPKDESRRRVRQCIDLVGLRGFEKHYPKALSGGMRMRASLARALTMDPPLFLLDEPFGALDEITRMRLNVELLKLFARAGFAAVFVTHSIPEAVFLSTRVAVMSSYPGRIIGEFDVPFEYPRGDSLRFDSRFTKIASDVSVALHDAMTNEDTGPTDGDDFRRGEGARTRTRRS